MPESVLDTENEDVDPSFDLDASMKSASDHMIESFCKYWISHLAETLDHMVRVRLHTGD